LRVEGQRAQAIQFPYSPSAAAFVFRLGREEGKRSDEEVRMGNGRWFSNRPVRKAGGKRSGFGNSLPFFDEQDVFLRAAWLL